MLSRDPRRFIAVAAVLVFCSASALAQSVAGPQGGSYLYSVAGDVVTSVSNDDGSIVEYHYDASGTQTGVSVSIRSTLLTLNTDGMYWVQAGALPPLVIQDDTNGRTSSATLYPSLYYVDGEWTLDVNGGNPIVAASFAYGSGGHLSSLALSSGLALQLAPASNGTFSQSLVAPNGTVAATATPQGGTNGVSAVPAQLDAVATRVGLGANWAETLTFTASASNHLTIGSDSNGEVRLYLVDAGAFRVGFSSDGAALFYDYVPQYSAGIDDDAAPAEAGVAPSHVVVTAEGGVGFYTDQPAYDAVYTAWVEANASGAAESRFATVGPAPAALRSSTASRFGIQNDMYRRYRSVVCAAGECWERIWFEWVDDPIIIGGGNGPGRPSATPPSGGGRVPVKTGNQITGDNKLRIMVDQGLVKAKTKLESKQCQALLSRLGIGNISLLDAMKGRGYEDPYSYLSNYLTFVRGSSSQCAGNPEASTTVYSRQVAICGAFGHATPAAAGNYLIHEMLHTLGYGESPKYSGFPSSSQINQDVRTACGN